MTKTFYISDPHFDHKNIIRLANRPFEHLDEMNEAMVHNWNVVVTEEDTVYCLGDFAWKRPDYWFGRLKGRKHLIEGNHDEKNTLILPWVTRNTYLELSDNGKNVILFHYPITDWNGKFHGSVHLFGHVHGADQGIKGPAFDVGAEKMRYTPRTLDQIFLEHSYGYGQEDDR